MTRRYVAPVTLTLALALAGCGSDVASAPQTTSTTRVTSATSTTTAPAPTTAAPTTTTARADCSPSDPADIAAIDAALRSPAARIGEAHTAMLGDGARLIAANIYDADGQRLSSSDLWRFEGAELYSLSSTARDVTAAPDGRDVDPGVFSSDEALAVGACVIG